MKTRTLTPMLALTLLLSPPALAQSAKPVDAPAPADLADQLAHAIGSDPALMNDSSHELLWHLAGLGPGLEAVRRDVIERCFRDPLWREPLLRGHDRVLRAAIGLCPQRLELSRQLAAVQAGLWLADMRQAIGDTGQTAAIVRDLAALDDALPPDAAAGAVDLLLESLASALTEAGDPRHLSAAVTDVLRALADLDGGIPRPAASQAAARLVAAMEAALLAGDMDELCAAGSTLAQLVRHQGPEHPGTAWHARAAEALVAGLAQADGLNELERPASTLAALVAAGVPGHEPAARAAGIVLAAMIEAARAGHPPGQLEAAGEGLSRLAGVLSAEDIPPLAMAITGAMTTAADEWGVLMWSRVLDSLGDNLPATATTGAAEALIDALATLIADFPTEAEARAIRLAAAAELAMSLAKLTGPGDPDAHGPARRAAGLLGDAVAQTDDPVSLGNLCLALGALGEAAPQAVVRRAADRVVLLMAEVNAPPEAAPLWMPGEALAQPGDNLPPQLWMLGEALAQLGDHLPPQASGRAAGLMVDAIAAGALDPSNPWESAMLGKALATHARHLATDPGQAAVAAALADRMLSVMQRLGQSATEIPEHPPGPFPALQPGFEPVAVAVLGRALAALDDHLAESMAARGADLVWQAIGEVPAGHLTAESLAWALLSLDLLTPGTHGGGEPALAIALRRGMLPGHTPRIRDEVERRHHRQVLEQYCALLSDTQLVELLKWPVVFDDAGQVILAELESRTGATFDGRRSSFIHQAESLGFDHATLRSPASRPRPPDPGRDP